VVDCNRIPRFAGFEANDLRGYIDIFGHLFFRVFLTLKPIKKACCNVVKANLEYVIIEVVAHAYVSQIGCRVVLA